MTKQLRLSVVHLIIAILALALCTSKLNGQHIEIVPYRLTPSYDVHCPINIELVEPVTFMLMPDIYKQEVYEILLDRVVFEETNPFALNEPFQVDDKYYQLIRIPNTGDNWYYGTWNHVE